jgi:hypothetical protein
MSPKEPVEDRRAAPGIKGSIGSLHWLKGLLARPLEVKVQGSKLRIVPIDRRRPARPDQPPSLLQLRSELRARVLAHELGETMSELAVVHDVLGRSGWPGVHALRGPVIRKALVQVEMLACDEPSPCLTFVIERLRAFEVAAQLRAERQAASKVVAMPSRVEISESSYEEFEQTARSWIGTLPAELAPTKRDV